MTLLGLSFSTGCPQDCRLLNENAMIVSSIPDYDRVR